MIGIRTESAAPAKVPLRQAALTLLAGGALAQLLPLLLGPLIARLFTPEAMGVFTQFATVAATLAVAASLRYEQALPLARHDAAGDAEAHALLALSLRVLLVAVAVSVPLAWALHVLGWLALPAWLPLAVGVAGALQVLMLWANRASRFKALAVSRVVQYGGAAALQLAGGWALWRGVAAGRDAAWTLVAATVLAQVAAGVWLCRPAPVGGWWAALKVPGQRLKAVARAHKDFALVNTPHAFLGTLQDALAVALLVAWAGDAAAGFWGLALRYLKAPATLVGQAVSQALYPRLVAAGAAEGQRLVRQMMALLGAVALAVMLLLLLAGPWLFERVFGAPWREAGELARALAPYIAVHLVASPLAVVTMAWRAQRWAFRLAVVGQVIFMAALALGLWQGGLIGGAWAVSAAMVPYFGWYFWRLTRWHQVSAPTTGGRA
ncbi:lipopolysaccharide biosynthesis protein [Ottowia sp.]|uniref:lipopolysaccharide biosynthesis protein n=1 Tax=Ottowia sp. TaxID=1898956 RepID=UPI003A851A0C